MKKQILIPTDFSENAKNAVYYGLRLYQNEPCRFILLNTYLFSYTTPDFPLAAQDVSSDRASVSFDSLLKEIKSDFPDSSFDIETCFRLGDITGVITSMVKERKIDLILMGTKGARGLAEVFIGSKTSSVIKQVKCPVLAIPDGCNFYPPTKIILAIDDQTDPPDLLLQPLLEILKKFNAELMLLHVVDHKTEKLPGVKERMESKLQSVTHSYHKIYDKSAQEGIESFVKENDASMLGMITHDANLLSRLFHRSTTKIISMHVEVPLLALHD